MAAPRISGEDIIVKMPKCKGTVYELFEIITQKTGLQFVYDSNVIHNDIKTSIRKGKYTIQQAVLLITHNRNLHVQIFESHILITPTVNSPTVQKIHSITTKQSNEQLITGRLIDKVTHRPLEAGSIRIENSSIGSVTNMNGEFRLLLPDSLRSSLIVFSHIGYNIQMVPAEKFRNDSHAVIELQEHIVPLQEVVLRLANPIHILTEFHRNVHKNYSQIPISTTSFYREGVEFEKRFVKLSEGVFRIYKPSSLSAEPDKVELLKMRNIVSKNEKDSVMAKIKAGIDASLSLDIIKSNPDFLNQFSTEYEFISTGITTIDDRSVNIIYFKQKEAVQQPYFCGELYIDNGNNALIGAQFEINPRFVKSAGDIFIVRKSRGMKVTPQKIVYNLQYKQWNGHYYINYVRGDLHFKIRTRRRWFGSSNLHTWFEMVTCKIDTTEVSRIARKERLPRASIFEDTNFPYDISFWDDFNIIPIEHKLSESIEKISHKIEELDKQ
jgi:hypothetical protein